MVDNKYLFLRGKSYSVKVTIPPSLCHVYPGKSHIIRTLKTKSLSIAQHRRHAAVAAIKEQFKTLKADAAKGIAEQLREIETKWQQNARRDQFGFRLPLTKTEKAEFEKDKARAYELGSPRIAESLGVSSFTAPATPLDHLEKAFFAERKLTERTQMHYRKTRRALEEFLQHEGLPVTLESVTRPTALAYQSWLVANDFHHVTGNAYLGGLRSRFNFLITKMAVKGENPFKGIVLKAPNTGEEPSRREWYANELKILFSSECDGELFDLMTGGLLLGARRSEVVRFKVKDYRGGFLHVTKGKSKAAIRKIPVSKLVRPALTAIVSGLAPDDYIFLRSKSGVALHTRGNLCGQRFERFRKALGLTDDATVYHSLRHTFMTLADESRPRHHVRVVVGHSDKKDTTSGYTRVSDRNRVRVVQAVVKALPAKVKAEISRRFGKG